MHEGLPLFTAWSNFYIITGSSAAALTGRDGTVVPLSTIGLEDGIDVDHGYNAFLTEYDGGKIDGFDNVARGLYPYARVRQSEIQPYWDLAQKYALADRRFATEASGSFTAHQDLIAGSAVDDSGETLVDYPSSAP
jgi:phospholipase C